MNLRLPFLMPLLLLSTLFLRAQTPAEEPTPSAQALLQSCTRMVPIEKLVLNGSLTLRRYRGFIVSESSFQLLLDWGSVPPRAECLLFEPQGKRPVQRAIMTRPDGKPATVKLFDGATGKALPDPLPTDFVRDTDLTWLDLSLDFLWWPNAVYEPDYPEKEFLGRECFVVLVKPAKPIRGLSGVRLWIDTKMHFLMKAEHLDAKGVPARRMWVQKVKKMDDRWMIRDMEVETIDTNHRTRLLIDDLAAP